MIKKILIVVVVIAIGLLSANLAYFTIQYASAKVIQGISGLIILWLLFREVFSTKQKEDISLIFVYPHTLRVFWFAALYGFICYFAIHQAFDMILSFIR